MEAETVKRVVAAWRIDPRLKRRFRRECKRQNTPGAHAIERAIALLLAEWAEAAKKSA
jgi:hypothetical protein